MVAPLPRLKGTEGPGFSFQLQGPSCADIHVPSDRHLLFLEDYTDTELPSTDSVQLEDVQWEKQHVALHIMELGCTSILPGRMLLSGCRRSKSHVHVLVYVTVLA